MGVPAFFRWLSRKYPAIVVHCVEEKPRQVGDTTVPVDTSQKNPNDIEFDNLYLDMNGIIHPCCHPENKPAPKNEDEMMVDIFAYIDRIFSIVRPRRLLYMAIDGVAPRAKMNQQRSRRFRASKESREKHDEMARIKEELRSKGAYFPEEQGPKEHFDSNCITPGTPFMFRLADCLRYYVHVRMNNDPGWRDIKVILSDANVPGEGEHKIMDYIRRQRAQPDHDPNTHHCLCGADADLIMLGLATHEPNFTIIREEFKPNQPRPCDICGQLGHEMKECVGMAREKQGENDEVEKLPAAEQEFIFLRLCILREYLEKELQMTNLNFKQDFERAIDDWVFMCFFVGNDFLPHLPSLAIREGAIDRLVKLYKKMVHKTGGYLTDSGFVNLSRVQLVLQELGEVEDEIFKKRRTDDLHFRKRNKEKRRRERQWKNAPAYKPGGQYTPQAPNRGGPSAIQNPRQTAYEMRVDAMKSGGRNQANEEAAANLRSMLTKNGSNAEGADSSPRGQKRKAENMDSDSDPEPEDEVKLWEDGWRERYYVSKFGVDADDLEFRHSVANAYVQGLCWVLRYYYQGCPSWKWYFPYHYSPFASDFVNIADLNTDFEKNTAPFKPLEQLMGVFPAASKQHLPVTWQTLMFDPESPIIDFYPENFKIDLNGKKYAWQGVALLPFVDEKRLWKALDSVYPDLTEEERSRNVRGNDRLFLRKGHSAYDMLSVIYENGGTSEKMDMTAKLTQGMQGKVWSDKFAVNEGSVVKSPLPNCKDQGNNQVISVTFLDPQFDDGFVFKAKILPNAKFPDKVLKPEDFNQNQSWRPQLGFTRGSGYRGRGSSRPDTARRFISGSLGNQPNQFNNRGGGPPSLMSQQFSRPGGQGGRDSYGQQGRQGNQGSYNQGNRNQGSHGGQMGWQRNLQGQQSAYQQNQQRGYQQDRYGNNRSDRGYGSQQSTYGGQVESYSTSSRSGSSNWSSSGNQGYQQRDNRQGGYSQRGGYNQRGGQNQRGGYSQRGSFPQPPSYQGRRY